MSGYTKLFSDILQSSIWNEDNKTRILWITMLAMSDKAGFVKAAPTSVALFARLSQEDTRAALNILESPDPESGTEADDGRRIEKIEGGWFIVNYEKYRNRLSTDEEAVKSRERMRKYREKHKGALPDVTLRNPVNAVGDGAGDVNAGKLAVYFLEKTSASLKRKLVTSPAATAGGIRKLIQKDITPDEIKATIDWLCTVNLKREFSFQVHSGNSLYEKYDKIRGAMGTDERKRNTRRGPNI